MEGAGAGARAGRARPLFAVAVRVFSTCWAFPPSAEDRLACLSRPLASPSCTTPAAAPFPYFLYRKNLGDACLLPPRSHARGRAKEVRIPSRAEELPSAQTRAGRGDRVAIFQSQIPGCFTSCPLKLGCAYQWMVGSHGISALFPSDL